MQSIDAVACSLLSLPLRTPAEFGALCQPLSVYPSLSLCSTSALLPPSWVFAGAAPPPPVPSLHIPIPTLSTGTPWHHRCRHEAV